MYELCFTEEDFFTGIPDIELGSDSLFASYPVSQRPRCVLQALISEAKLNPQYFKDMVKDVLGYTDVPDVCESVFYELLNKVRKHSTCDTLTSPIEVYVDDFYYVTVYEDREDEVA